MWKRPCQTDFVGFMKDGAQWLVDNTDIKLVGELQIVSFPAEFFTNICVYILFVSSINYL